MGTTLGIAGRPLAAHASGSGLLSTTEDAVGPSACAAGLPSFLHVRLIIAGEAGGGLRRASLMECTAEHQVLTLFNSAAIPILPRVEEARQTVAQVRERLIRQDW